MRKSRSTSENEKMRNASLFKTTLCHYYVTNKQCPFGSRCDFAHGHEDLRSPSEHPKHKTKMCRWMLKGFACPFGSKCHFIHCDRDEARADSSSRAVRFSKAVNRVLFERDEDEGRQLLTIVQDEPRRVTQLNLLTSNLKNAECFAERREDSDLHARRTRHAAETSQERLVSKKASETREIDQRREEIEETPQAAMETPEILEEQSKKLLITLFEALKTLPAVPASWLQYTSGDQELDSGYSTRKHSRAEPTDTASFGFINVLCENPAFPCAASHGYEPVDIAPVGNRASAQQLPLAMVSNDCDPVEMECECGCDCDADSTDSLKVTLF